MHPEIWTTEAPLSWPEAPQDIDRIIDRFRMNPRAQRSLEFVARFARAQIPHLRIQVKSMLSQVRLEESGSSHANLSLLGSHGPIAKGTYSELEVRSRRIGWRGKVDLLVISPEACEITDFKTGKPSEAHRFQLVVYALLWALDEERNPRRARSRAGPPGPPPCPRRPASRPRACAGPAARRQTGRAPRHHISIGPRVPW